MFTVAGVSVSDHGITDAQQICQRVQPLEGTVKTRMVPKHTARRSRAPRWWHCGHHGQAAKLPGTSLCALVQGRACVAWRV